MPSMQCINCGVRLERIRRHLLRDERQALIDVIHFWTHPRDATPSDHICHACWELADHAAQLEITSRRDVGHRHVCVVCGRSILRMSRRRVIFQEPNEQEQRMTNIISIWIQPRELSSQDEACVPCYLRAQRASRRSGQPEPQELIHNENVPDAGQHELIRTCCLCNNTFEFNDVRSTTNERQIMEIISELMEHQQVPSTSEVCPSCWERAQRLLDSRVTASEPRHMTLPNIRRAAETPGHCIFRGCTGSERHVVPEETRRRILIEYFYFIPRGARICNLHLHEEQYEDLYVAEYSLDTFSASHVEEIFFILMEPFTNISYENIHNYPEHQVKYIIGLTKRQHQAILAETPSLRNLHRGSFALTVLLCKLRTGDSGDRLSILFKVPRRTLETLMSVARDLLLREYVPQHLGFQHIRREQIVQKNSLLAEGIFGEPEAPLDEKPAITIADATYLYTQKSSNYLFQKETYSLHKYRNLLKPFILCACNGYIINVYGPYSATTNDATIMCDLLNQEDFNTFFRQNDVFILDRGFRDCMDSLHEKGYLGFMPETKEEGHSQLTTLEANRSRCVTINRWVIEAVNGRFKRDFRIFRNEYFNRACRHLMDNFKIAAALLNHFCTQYTDSENAEQYLIIINERLFLRNSIAELVLEHNLNRRSSYFVPIDGTTMPFPRLSMQELTLFACGTYQLKQARSYVGEHFRFHGVYTLEVCREQISGLEGVNPMLVRAKIKSRHSSAKTYFVFVVIERNVNGRDGILSYCCNCMVGLRTIGCCSHVMSIVWYLGYARHEGLTRPAPFLDEVIVIVVIHDDTFFRCRDRTCRLFKCN